MGPLTVGDELRHRKKRAFLTAFVETGTVTGAARAVKIHRATHYQWLEADPVYADAFAQAQEASLDLVESEARRRAVDGVRKLVLYKGEPVTDPETGELLYETTYSDVLLMFILNGRRGDVFNRTRHEHSGPDGAPIPIDLRAALAVENLTGYVQGHADGQAQRAIDTTEVVE